MANEKPLILKDGKKSQMVSGVDTIDPVFLPVASSYQKYFIASAETYTIPINFSSVVSGPFEIDSTGVVDVEGRLEII